MSVVWEDAARGRAFVSPGDEVAPGRRIVRRLGAGVDYEIFAVDDARRGRCVAKIVRPEVLAAGRSCVLLAHEASALTEVRHPSVVRCLDVELRGAHPHLLLEYVDGLTLRQVLRARRTLPPAEVAAIGRALAAALATVGAAGWLHLDVKPENIVYGRVPCLLDFSIAQRSAKAVVGDEAAGTLAYMAPEQRPGANRPLGPAADVLGLARTLAEALTGTIPTDGPRTAPLPPPLESILGPALGPLPELRPTAAQLAVSLAAIARQ